MTVTLAYTHNIKCGTVLGSHKRPAPGPNELFRECTGFASTRSRADRAWTRSVGLPDANGKCRSMHNQDEKERMLIWEV